MTDECSAASFLWDFTPAGAMVTAAPAILNNAGWRYVYVGADDGKIWQVRPIDGVGLAHATIGIGTSTTYEAVVFYDGSSSRLLTSSGSSIRGLCIPWPDTPGDKAWLRLPAVFDPAAPEAETNTAFDRGERAKESTTSKADDDLGRRREGETSERIKE